MWYSSLTSLSDRPVQLAALPPQSKDAHILYSNLSGKEILQQWMAKHPEVVQKYRALEAADAKESRETKRRNYEVVDESQSGQQAATGIAAQHQLPQELQPYREVLPPSLLPPAMRSQFPGSTDPPEWG